MQPCWGSLRSPPTYDADAVTVCGWSDEVLLPLASLSAVQASEVLRDISLLPEA